MTALVNLIDWLTRERRVRGRWQATPRAMRTHMAHYAGSVGR